MGDDEKQSPADRMKSNDDESKKLIADSKRDTKESASLQERLNTSDEESDPSAVTRPSREDFGDKFQDALDRAKEQAAAAEDDDDESPSGADTTHDKDDD